MQNSSKSERDEASPRRLIMVSNRLPVALERTEDGQWQTQSATGGLVAALDPIMRRRGGIWVGWPGLADADTTGLRDVLDTYYNKNADYRLEPVALSEDEIHNFYEGFSNEVIWPLFHNRFTSCNFEPDYWRMYQQVNRKFAQRVSELIEDDDFIWVHDYHLVNVAQELRLEGVRNQSGFFQHIPFPAADIFRNLPWWREMLHALLAYDFIGLQTANDQNNFLASLKALFDSVEIRADGDCVDLEIADPALGEGQRHLRVGALPIGIDYASVAKIADSEKAIAYMRDYRDSWRATQILLGVDRLDYTKGLPQKMAAFRNALRRYPELHSRISLQQHVVPSRQTVPEYADQKIEIERLVGEINGEFTLPGWVPIHYLFHHMTPEELMAHYRAADIALITPPKDGMNLVSKEYCAANIDETGVLILSEFAGSAEELGEYALLVNPQDIEATADRIYEAYRMPADERGRRMRAMREIVRDNDAFTWVHRFLAAAGVDEPA